MCKYCHDKFHRKYKFEALDKPELLVEYLGKTKGKIVTGKAALDKHEKVFGGYYLSKDEIEWILIKLRGLKYPPEEFNIFTKVFAKLAEAYDKK